MQPLEGIQLLQEAWAAVPLVGKALGIAVTLFIASTRWMASWRRQQIAQKYAGVGPNSDLPEIVQNAPQRVVLPVRKTFLDWLLYGAALISDRLSRRSYEFYEISKDADDADLHFGEAIARAARTRGLRFLPPGRQRNILQLRISYMILEECGAPPAAFERADAALNEYGEDFLVNALFSPVKLERADLTPAVGKGTTYFTKYFQTIMTLFHEKSFRQSAGAERESHQVLIEHWKQFSRGRARAALVEGLDGDARVLISTLRVKVPAGYNQEKKREARNYNRKEAATSMAIVAARGRSNSIEQVTGQVHLHLRTSSPDFLELTGEADGGAKSVVLWHNC